MKHELDIKYTNIITIFVCFLYHCILLFQKLRKIITMNNEELSNKILLLRVKAWSASQAAMKLQDKLNYGLKPKDIFKIMDKVTGRHIAVVQS